MQVAYQAGSSAPPLRRTTSVARAGAVPPNSALATARPDLANVYYPTLIGSALFEQERVRTGGNFGLQFRPSDRIDLNLTGLYSKLEADNFNHNYMAWFSNMFDAGAQRF